MKPTNRNNQIYHTNKMPECYNSMNQ